MGFFIVILAMGFFAVVFIAVIKAEKRRKLEWAYAAKNLHLKFYPGTAFSTGVISGKYHGHHVHVETITKGSGDNSTTYTRFRIGYAQPLKTKFTLTRQSRLHNFGKVFGFEDIETGDASFDNTVLVKGVGAAGVLKFLNPQRRRIIKLTILSGKDVVISDHGLELLVDGKVGNARIIINQVKRLTKVVDLLTGHHHRKHAKKEDQNTAAPTETADETAAAIAEPILEEEPALGQNEVKIELPEPSVSVPESGVQVIPEPEDDISGTDDKWTRMAKVKFPEGVPVAENDLTDSDSFAELPDEGTSPSESSVSTENVTEPEISSEPDPVRQSGAVSIEDIAEELFVSGATSFDAIKIFENKYSGKPVSWKGKLLSANQFSFDFVFKNSSGVKAEFELIEIKSKYSSSKIKACVHFSEDMLGELDSRMYQQFEFSGTLLSADMLLKKIFITDGKL